MIARGYVEAGARVYISSRKAPVCQEVGAGRSAGGGVFFSMPGGLAHEPGVRRLPGEAPQGEGRVPIPVDNAGATGGAPIEEFPGSAFDKVLNLNVKAPF